MHVSLAEALEVRGGPLEEEEIWAVLSQSAECLQDLFHKADPIALGFIISPWSLLLLPSGNISYTDENVSNQDLRAFTAPEVLQSRPLSCLSDVEKMHVYSLGMTLYWGADYKIPLDQPIKLGDHLNSILLNMCEDLMYTRVTIRTILDACSAHIRNSNCAPAFSYIKQLVKLVLGSLTTLNRLSLNTISKPDRNQEIRDRLRGKGLPIENSKKEAPKGTEKYKAQFCERASLNRGLSKSMGFLAITDKKSNMASCHTASGQEDTVEVYNKPRSRNCFDRKQNTIGDSGHWKLWTSTVDLDFDGSKVISSGDNTHWRSLSPQGKGRQIKCITQAREPKYRDFGHVPTTLGFQNPPQTFQLSTSSALSEAYERIKERQRKLQVLREAMVMDEPTGLHSAHHSDIYSTASESTSLVSSDPDNRPVHRNDDIRRYSSQTGEDEFLAESYISKKRSSSLYEIPGDENIVSQELMLKRQEEELKQLQNKLNRKQFQSGVHQADMVKVSMLDITRDPLRDVAIETSMTQRKLKNFFGPEFVKMISEPSVALELPASILTKSGKGEDIRRKVNIMLLSGQCLELTCDTKSTCKDVFDMVVAHIGLVEHHFFSLAYLKENEFFFVAPDCKLSKVAPEGWKEAKKKNRLTVNFILFLRIKFSVEDVGLIQHTLTRHQYYLQLRRDILEERLHCNDETAMLLASLALQAEFGDYQPEFHGMSYYRLEHYLPIGVIESLEESYVKEELPKLHSTYCGATEAESEFEFLKICQKLSEYGVLFYRVLPEKKSLTGINLGICSKGVMVYEIQNGLKTVVLRFPWRDTKKIAFTRKKITLQNTSDGIKHQFQTDSSKTCQYLIHLASSQHKFQLQMRARKNNQDLQEIESLSVSNLNYNGDSAGLFSMGRVNSSISLAASAHSRLTDQSHLMRSELLKRMSRSEAALNQPLYDISKDKIYRTLWDQHPPILSKSSYDLRQVSESKRRSTPNFSYQLFRSSNLLEGDTERKVKHSCHRSDTESVVGSERRIKNSVINPKKSQAVLHRSPARRNPGSDSSSTEEAYAIGISMHSSGIPSTPATLTANDTLHQKFSALPSPERELRCIRLKKDVKHGLGFQIVGGEKTGKLDLGIFVTTIMPGGPAELDHRLKPGDRLISVNGITLEGITHDRAVEILQNAPEDVTLVVSQLKEKLYRGTDFSSGTRNKSRSPCRNLGRRDYEEVSSSEEHNGSSGHHRTLPVRTSVPPEEKRRGSTSSQDSRTESAGLSQSQVHGFYRNRTTSRTPQRTDYEEVSALTDLRQDMIQNVLDSARPLNSTNVETPKETDCSDRGDSDMDEATYSSSQEQQSSKKDSVADKVKRRAFPEAKQSTLLKPGDIFEVELSKIENSLGISVTGGINTSVRHGGIYVKGIIPGGAAEADGRIKKGDRVLSVNGICLEGATHKQAVETLRSTGQVVNLLVEKGQLPAASVHAPVTPQCTPPCAANQSTSCESADKQEVVPEIMSSNAKDCTSINDGDIFKVKLIKNSSGLGFSFTEGNDGFPEHNGNAVKIKKLFAGQPAAESGKINVGDVIMQVNDISLKGLSKQEIVSVLRRTSQEVTLLLYRLKSGVSADIGSPLSVRDSQTNEAYRSKLQKQSLDNLLISGKMNTSIVDEEDVEVERELQNPRDSYRDCSNADDVDKCPILKDHVAKCSMLKDEFSNKKMTTISQLPGNATSFSSSQYKMPSCQEETFQNIYFSPQESSRHELINRKPPSPMFLDHAPQQGFKLQPVVPSPTPVDANCISCSSASEMDSSISDTIAIPAQHQDSKNLEEEDSELQPEVELHVTLKKSEKGSLGFTVTKGDANIGSYIHDIIQDPAKSDGRLRPGDRLIMVNGVDITSMSHAEAVEFLRSIPDTVTLVIGRVLEIPEFPIKPHSLPDITLMWHKHELGLSVAGGSDTACQSIYISDISPGSVADKEGSLQPLDIIHHINGVSTHGMTTNEARRTLQNAGPTVTLKVTRDGEPVFAKAMECSVQSNDKCLKRNESVEVNGDIYGNRQNECDQVSSVEVPKNNVIHFELQKPITGGLGFSLVGGENGAFVKSVHPGGAADVDGRLQVGDQLLKVNGECVVGMSHTKAVTTIRKAKGLVNLTVSRAKSSSEMRSTTKDADSKDSFSKVQHHTGISDPEAEVLKSLSDVVQQEVNKYFSFNPTNSTPKDTPGKGTHFVKTPDTVEYIGELKEEEMSAKSEDTDYEGFSLPEDSPEQPRKNDYHLSTSIEKIIQEVSVEDASESQTLVENTEKGEVAWRSEELPIDTLQQDVSSIDEWPITKEKLATLSVVKVPLASQYTGSKLDAIVKTLHRLLDQQIPSQEFEHLQDLKPLDECLIGQTKDNRRKNRYKNILPYDGTRVPIGEEHEYINASFIKIPVDKHDYIYIACQGPLPHTLADFWQMVWEQESNVIAMMTLEVEGGKVKCQRYWPEHQGKSIIINNKIKIILQRCQSLEEFIIRKIEMINLQSGESRQVTHLNFTAWPDHGTPDKPEQLVAFLSYMRHIKRTGSLIVHCSAGIGRSGTLICLDTVLTLISKGLDFDISHIVETMRCQRYGMIQTEAQYIFCYQVILYILTQLQLKEKETAKAQ